MAGTAGGPPEPIGSDAAAMKPVELLKRWEDFGAPWQVIARDEQHVVISLCRCDGGEEVERLTSTDADLLAYVSDRLNDEQ